MIASRKKQGLHKRNDALTNYERRILEMDNLENKATDVQDETAETVEEMETVEKGNAEEAGDTPKKGFSVAFSAFAHKTADLGKKAADGMQKGAKALSEKMKQDSYDRRKKKYNPITMEEFKDENFHTPNIIKIVDDAVRKGIDVCEGAIGWLGTEAGAEVLYLYDDAVKDSGIEFLPTDQCDQVYLVDQFDKSRFIKVDTIFERSHNERLAELEHIAYSLGAKSCLIEIEYTESEETTISSETKSHLKGDFDTKIDARKLHYSNDGDIDRKHSREIDENRQSHNYRSGKNRVYFSGNSVPVTPRLKWFEKDDMIKNLIEMRCTPGRSVSSKTLVLEGKTSSTMARETAQTLDVLLNQHTNVAYKKVNVKDNRKTDFHLTTSMVARSIRESNSKLIFDVEFE